MAKSVHDGHRERVRAELCDGNFNEKTPPHKVLEALLYYSIPRGDTNVIAHDLINTFGSFEKVFSADIKELTNIKGVGKNTAIQIKLIGIAIKRSYEDRHRKLKSYVNLDEVCKMMVEKCYGVNREMVSISCFDAGGKFTGFYVIGEGDISMVGISLRTMFEAIIDSKATSVLLAHNHPNGFAVPSQEDIDATEQIKKSLGSINVTLVDHILIDSDNKDYVSLKNSQQYKYLF